MRALIVMMSSLLFAVAGCVAPSPQANADAEARSRVAQPSQENPAAPAAAPQTPVPTSTPQAPKTGQPIKMPPMSDPLPPDRVQVPSPTPVQVVRTCQVDSDCVVKDVGNCCGYFPACVHRNSPTDPAGVRAQCSKSSMASVCGFNEITACRCVRNQCVGEQEPVGGWMDDPPAPPPANR